jgi:peptide methionine sulfoxide reductase msrA/msrB
LPVFNYKYSKMKKAIRKLFSIPVLSVLVFAVSSCTLPKSSASGSDAGKEKGTAFAVNKSIEDWQNTLTPEQFNVLINKGTERPFTGKLLHNDKKGNYACAACGNELFSSDAKFDSKTGWPSFDKEIGNGKIMLKKDNSDGIERTEVICARCGGHLGHVFEDGPTKTGLRYCINSVSLGFNETGKNVPAISKASDTVVLAGGCFWSMQAIYQELKGVTNVAAGYSGGTKANPTYEDVGTGNTGYAESVQVVYNPNEIKLVDILKVFFSIHNPTTLNKQGADEGTQYRSAIFFNDEQQKNVASEVISSLQKNKVFDKAIITQVQPLNKFYKAEDYHQDYYNNNKGQGYCQVVVAPKIEKFEKAFKDLLKQ